MCSDDHANPTRRRFLQWTGASTIGLTALTSQIFTAYADTPSKDKKYIPKPQNVISPKQALERLMQGNDRYVKGLMRRHDFLTEREALEDGQNPYATILSCSDSRIGPEYAFDTARGDIFVVRLAGNFVNEEGLGSIEYSVKELQVPLIMILGHDNCGAINAAVKMEKENKSYPGKIQLLAKTLVPSVQKVLNKSGNLLENAIQQNLVDSIKHLVNSSPIINEAVKQKKLKLVGAIYKIENGKINLIST